MNVAARNTADLLHVDAVLYYLAPTGERPCRYAGLLEQDGQGAARYERCRVRIHDARAIAESLSLNDEGCRLVRHESATRDFWSDQEVARTYYYPEMET